MSLVEVHEITRQANLLREKSGVVCRYEWFRSKSRSQWSFYRHGHYIASTAVRSQVILKMKRYVEFKEHINAAANSTDNTQAVAY